MKRSLFFLTLMLMMCTAESAGAQEISCIINAQSVPCRVSVIVAEKAEDFTADEIVGFESRVFNTHGEHEIVIALRKDIPHGEYFLIVKNNEQKEITPIYIQSAKDIETALAKVNAAEPDKLGAVIEENARILDIWDCFSGEYSMLTAEGKRKVLEELSKQKYTEASAFKAAFTGLVSARYGEESLVRSVLEEINGAAAEDIPEMISKYGAILGLDIDSQYGWAMLKTENSEYIGLVGQALAGKNFEITKMQDLKEAFTTGCALAALNCADYLKLENVIKNYIDLLSPINMSSYNKLHADDKTIVMKTLAAAEHDSVTAFVTAFNSETARYAPKTVSSSGGSGGSGGGSFSSAPAIIMSENEPSPAALFNDLESCPWAQEAVYSLKGRGIVSGRGDNSFAPDDMVTRAEFAAMLVLALDVYDGSADADFEDVSEVSWSYSYVASAKQAGIVRGKSEKIFAPNENITRAEAAIMTYNALSLSGYGFMQTQSIFSDTEGLDENIRMMIDSLSAVNVINGNGEGAFEPFESATRAQAAVIFYIMLSLIGGYK